MQRLHKRAKIMATNKFKKIKISAKATSYELKIKAKNSNCLYSD